MERFLALALCALLWLALILAPGQAHDAPSGWPYPGGCCAGVHCAPLPAEMVERTAEGYLIVPTGELIPYKVANSSPDGDYHYCIRDDAVNGETIRRSVKDYEVMDRSTLCFWAPRNGL